MPRRGEPRTRRTRIELGYARLAQSVERQALNLMVVGSSPTVGVVGSFVPRSETPEPDDLYADMRVMRREPSRLR